MIRAALVVVVVLVAACGGGKPDKVATTTPEPPETPVVDEPAAAPIGAEIDAFHAALAPRWHAVGPTRMADTCGAVADLQTKVAAVRGVGAPTGVDGTAWTAAMQKVESTLGGLKTACVGTDLHAFEAAFTALHVAFHEYMDLVVGEHGHGEGDGRGGREGIPRPRTP